MNLEEIISKMPINEQEHLFEMAEEYMSSLKREKAQHNFMDFVHEMWPGFIHGRHHAILSKKFEEIAQGKLKRLMISLPPRHTKSEFGSFLLPAWFLGRDSTKNIINIFTKMCYL